MVTANGVEPRKSLTVEIRVGESVSIDSGRVVITLREKSGQRARVSFSAEAEVSIEPVRARAIEEPITQTG